MDPETEGHLNDVRESLRMMAASRQASSAEWDAKLRNLRDIVFSLARASSEHHVKLDKLIEVVAPLTQTVRDDHQTISRIRDILVSLAATDEQIRREFQERNARVDEEHRRHDEQFADLIRRMDEWFRRNPPNGKGA
jgi:hypothetical protein